MPIFLGQGTHIYLIQITYATFITFSVFIQHLLPFPLHAASCPSFHSFINADIIKPLHILWDHRAWKMKSAGKKYKSRILL